MSRRPARFTQAEPDPMKDESMVEVLARAMCYGDPDMLVQTLYVHGNQAIAGEPMVPLWTQYTEHARACLQALLDHGPTEEMVEAGRSTVGGHLRNEAVAPIFRAMISKALGK